MFYKHASAFLQPAVIDEYLQNELDKGRVAGPFVHPPWPNLHVSCFGVIPKKHQPGKWHLILDLSSPPDASVNDGIPRDSYSVHYTTVDDIIDGIIRYGRGTLMVKFDVESAYRNVAIHPEDRFLLGMQWRGWHFVDMALPFGLRSVPFIFNSIADRLEWRPPNPPSEWSGTDLRVFPHETSPSLGGDSMIAGR